MINQIVYGIMTSLAIIGLFTQLAWFALSIAYGQQQILTLENTYVKIMAPSTDQQVPAGPLTINGISSDNGTTNCEVYVDWNDLKPYQKVIPAGPWGQNDYSNWTFTYTDAYHLITEGTNELTSKISCYSSPANITKHYSINVTGVATGASAQALPSVINSTDADRGFPSSPPASPPAPSSPAPQLPVGPSSDTGISTEEETATPPPPPPAPNENENNGEGDGENGEEGEEANDEDIGDLFG
jgi:hypothetical protein